MFPQPYVAFRLAEQRQRDLELAAPKRKGGGLHSGPDVEGEGSLVATKLRVQLIGPFCVSLGPKVAGPWPRPPAKRLCELVFVSPGQRIAREVVFEELFPDLSPTEAGKALSRALSLARATLSPLGRSASRLLQADRTFVWADRDLLEDVDLDCHEAALRGALAAAAGAERDDLLVKALEPTSTVLEDEPFASWAIAARERLECLRRQARLVLARDRAGGKGRSQPGSVVDAWEDCLAHDPICEEAGAALIRAYAAQGKKALAEATYKRCCKVLQEFGLYSSDILEEAHESVTPTTHYPIGPDARPVSGAREERRLVSVVCVELATGRNTSANGAEELADLVAWALVEIVSQVKAFGGTVTAMTGMGLVALFGVPRGHEDDPERALRASFGAIAASGAGAKGVAVRAGVETGTIFTMPIGSAGEYVAIGETVEAAAALQAAARPASVLVGPVTRAATEGLFHWGPAQTVPVTTRAEPLSAAYMERPRARPARSKKGRGLSGTVSLIGRAPEISSVQEALGEALAGHGRIVAITGEAGLGKTRLVEELHRLFIAWSRAAPGRLPLWLSGDAIAHLRATPYGLYRRILSAWLNVTPEQGEDVVLPALERALAASAGHAAGKLFGPLSQVMGMNIREKATSSGLTRLQRPELTTAEAIKCMVSSLLSYGPAVVVLEDLQWADPGSIEATRGLMSLALEGPLLIVLTWRHKGSQEMAVLDTALEAVPSSMTRRVELRPLSATEERDLARALLGDPTDEVLDGLVDGADGNPLLLQERLATSLETKAVVKCDAGWRRLSGIRAEVPDSVQRLVQSRLDHLEPNQREALVAASVLGPDFTMASVAAVADLDIDLGQIASDLCREGLLAEAHTRPEVTYRFEHAVFRTAIYQSVLESERSRLSARAASALQSAAS